MNNRESFGGPQVAELSSESAESTELILSPEAEAIVAEVEEELAPEIAEAQGETDPTKQKGLFEKLAETFRIKALRYFTIAAMAAMPYMSSSAEAGEVRNVGSVAELREQLALAQQAKSGGLTVQEQINIRQQTQNEAKTEAQINIAEIKTTEQANQKRVQLEQKVKESDAKIALAEQKQDHKERMDLIRAARDDRKQAMSEIKTLNKMEINLRNQDLKEYKTVNEQNRKNTKMVTGMITGIIKAGHRR